MGRRESKRESWNGGADELRSGGVGRRCGGAKQQNLKEMKIYYSSEEQNGKRLLQYHERVRETVIIT